ncbi:MAG: isoprenylcysteine carboxylmethyltransferase family protein [Fibrobacterales bacterium]
MNKLSLLIPPPLVMALFGGIQWSVTRTPFQFPCSSALFWGIVALLLSLSALFGIGGVIQFIRAKTTVNPLKPENSSSLVTSGLFAYTRNPMYVSFLFLLLTWGLFLYALVTIIPIVGFILYLNRFQIIPEESLLTEVYGDTYVEYYSKTPRWLFFKSH